MVQAQMDMGDNTTTAPVMIDDNDDDSDLVTTMMNNTEMNNSSTTTLMTNETMSPVAVVPDDDDDDESGNSSSSSSNNSNNNSTEASPIDTLFNTTTGTESANNTIYPGCDVEEYYASLPTNMTSWTMEMVEALLVETHRNILPSLIREAEENILDALVDLDAGNTTGTVYLYMRDIDFDADQQNTPEGWKRGDIWPLRRGADVNTPAGTDVHSKLPEDWEVDTELKNLFWGVCGTVEEESKCVTPAIPEQTAVTSATDYKIKTPPVKARGMVARQVLYTALRYRTELGLTLSDCPPFNVTEYGYLSELLKWHEEYPVTDMEKERNDRACARWQGNRNPFVDHPQLVAQMYGVPDTIREGTLTYSICTDPTDSPTATPNECSALSPGDINALIFNSDPIDQIVFFPVSDIPESIGSIYVTDRAWNGTDFVTDEGTIEVGSFFDFIFPFNITKYLSTRSDNCKHFPPCQCNNSIPFHPAVLKRDVCLVMVYNFPMIKAFGKYWMIRRLIYRRHKEITY
jgi:endonuclease I